MNTNSFGTSPTDRLRLGDRVTQVTADTGSTVLLMWEPMQNEGQEWHLLSYQSHLSYISIVLESTEVAFADRFTGARSLPCSDRYGNSPLLECS